MHMLRIIAVLLLPFIYTFGKAFVLLFPQIDLNESTQVGFWIAFVSSGLLMLWKLKPTSFFATFEHELTHNFWAFFTLHKTRSFSVKSNGEGAVEFEGKGNFMITLSPYFFPTFSIIILPFRDLLKEWAMMPYFIVFGIVLAYHTVTSIKETHSGQSDLKRNGLFFSYVLIILGNIVFLGLAISFTQDGWSGIGKYFADSLNVFVELFEWAITKMS